MRYLSQLQGGDDFPPTSEALDYPCGLLAVGGDLSADRLVHAYRKGIFPWYEEPQPVLWWTPDPRSVLFPDALYVSRSLRRTLRRNRFRLSLDTRFPQVMARCAELRGDGLGTWIGKSMIAAYCDLHALGHAHSVEVWDLEGELVGGLYGIALGRAFFGESMFSRVTDASKVAFAFLARQLNAWGFALIDCQVYSPHLASLGAEQISRPEFISYLDAWCPVMHDNHAWRLQPALANAPW